MILIVHPALFIFESATTKIIFVLDEILEKLKWKNDENYKNVLSVLNCICWMNEQKLEMILEKTSHQSKFLND